MYVRGGGVSQFTDSPCVYIANLVNMSIFTFKQSDDDWIKRRKYQNNLNKNLNGI